MAASESKKGEIAKKDESPLRQGEEEVEWMVDPTTGKKITKKRLL
jgi:hypothetical protein